MNKKLKASLAALGCLTESQEACALAAWLDMTGALYCHVPNGGKLSARNGFRLKREGVKPGVPDYLIFSTPPGSELKGVAIELKRIKGSTTSVEQIEWGARLSGLGWAFKVCHGAQEAIAWLKSMGY